MCHKIHHLGGSWKWRYPWWIEGKIHLHMDDLGVPPCLIGLPHQVFAADARSLGVRDPPATNCNELLAGKTGFFCRGLTNKHAGSWWDIYDISWDMRGRWGRCLDLFFFQVMISTGMRPQSNLASLHTKSATLISEQISLAILLGRVSFGGSTYTTQQII